MNKKIYFTLSILGVLLLASSTAWAANDASNNYGLSVADYAKALYSIDRLKNFSDCMKPVNDDYAAGKITQDAYYAKRTACNDASYAYIAPSLKTQTLQPAPLPELPSKADPAVAAREEQYRKRYFDKCMADVDPGNQQMGACCGNLAGKDAADLETRGVFDTASTAEIPVYVDEGKCVASVAGKQPAEMTQDEFVQKCLTTKYKDQNSQEAEKLCATDYRVEIIRDRMMKCINNGQFGPVGQYNADILIACSTNVRASMASDAIKSCVNSGTYKNLTDSDRVMGCLDDYMRSQGGGIELTPITSSPSASVTTTSSPSLISRIASFFSSLFSWFRR